MLKTNSIAGRIAASQTLPGFWALAPKGGAGKGREVYWTNTGDRVVVDAATLQVLSTTTAAQLQRSPGAHHNHPRRQPRAISGHPGARYVM